MFFLRGSMNHRSSLEYSSRQPDDLIGRWSSYTVQKITKNRKHRFGVAKTLGPVGSKYIYIYTYFFSILIFRNGLPLTNRGISTVAMFRPGSRHRCSPKGTISGHHPKPPAISPQSTVGSYWLHTAHHHDREGAQVLGGLRVAGNWGFWKRTPSFLDPEVANDEFWWWQHFLSVTAMWCSTLSKIELFAHSAHPMMDQTTPHTVIFRDVWGKLYRCSRA